MIEKMKFLSIAGPKDDIDRVIDQYLSKYEIHLENALSELKTVASLRPYTETNPYKAELQTAAGLMESYHRPSAQHLFRKAFPKGSCGNRPQPGRKTADTDKEEG